MNKVNLIAIIFVSIIAQRVDAISPECLKHLSEASSRSITEGKTLPAIMESLRSYSGRDTDAQSSLVQLTMPLTSAVNLAAIERLKSLALDSGLLMPADLSRFGQINGTMAMTIVLSGRKDEFQRFIEGFNKEFSNLAGATFADLLQPQVKAFDPAQLAPTGQLNIPTSGDEASWLSQVNQSLVNSRILTVFDMQSARMGLLVDERLYQELRGDRPNELAEVSARTELKDRASLREYLTAPGAQALGTVSGSFVVVGFETLMKFAEINRLRQEKASAGGLPTSIYEEIQKMIETKAAIPVPAAESPKKAAPTPAPVAPPQVSPTLVQVIRPKPLPTTELVVGETMITEITTPAKRAEILKRFSQGVPVMVAQNLRTKAAYAVIDPRLLSELNPEAAQAKLNELKEKLATETKVPATHLLLPEAEEGLMAISLGKPGLQVRRVGHYKINPPNGGSRIADWLDRTHDEHKPVLLVHDEETQKPILILVRLGQKMEEAQSDADQAEVAKPSERPEIEALPAAMVLPRAKATRINPMVVTSAVATPVVASKPLSLQEAAAMEPKSAMAFNSPSELGNIVDELLKTGVRTLQDPETKKTYVLVSPETAINKPRSELEEGLPHISLKTLEMLEIFAQSKGDTGFVSFSPTQIASKGGIDFVRAEFQGDPSARKDFMIITGDDDRPVAILAANRILAEMQADALRASRTNIPAPSPTPAPRINVESPRPPTAAPATSSFAQADPDTVALAFADYISRISTNDFSEGDIPSLLNRARSLMSADREFIGTLHALVADEVKQVDPAALRALETSNPDIHKKLNEILGLLKSYSLDLAKEKAREERQALHAHRVEALSGKIRLQGQVPRGKGVEAAAKARKILAEIFATLPEESLIWLDSLDFHIDFAKEAEKIPASERDALINKLKDIAGGSAHNVHNVKITGGTAVRFNGNQLLVYRKGTPGGRNPVVIGTEGFASASKGKYFDELEARIAELGK